MKIHIHTHTFDDKHSTQSDAHIPLEDQTQIGITAPAAQSIHRRPGQVKPCHCEKRSQWIRISTVRAERHRVLHTHLYRCSVCRSGAEPGTLPSGPNQKVSAGMHQTAPPSDHSTEDTCTLTKPSIPNAHSQASWPSAPGEAHFKIHYLVLSVDLRDF